MIVEKQLEIDQKYGLPKKLQITKLTIDSITKTIIIGYRVVIVSPTNEVLITQEEGEFYRYNGETNFKYNELENSPIGQGIKQMLNSNLEMYPNFEQDK